MCIHHLDRARSSRRCRSKRKRKIATTREDDEQSVLQPEKRVRFAATGADAGRLLDEVFLVPRVTDIPGYVANSVWYDEDEFGDLLKSHRRTVRLMEWGIVGDLENGASSTRGLECRTTRAFRARTAKRQRALGVILAEQDRQRKSRGRQQEGGAELLFEYDDERIAHAYSRHTAGCALEALFRARRDAKEAAKEYGSDPRPIPPTQEPQAKKPSMRAVSSASFDGRAPTKNLSPATQARKVRMVPRRLSAV